MSEWDQRQLCPDGACTGLLGNDGTCKVCGKRGRAADAAATSSESGNALRGEPTDFDQDDEYYYEDEDEDGDDDDDDGEDDDDDEGDAEPDEDGVARASAGGAGGSPEWSKRKLCPDGACVGVIGDDGRCKVCGKTA